MTARIVWLIYLALGFVIVPLLFRARHGRWPFAYAFPPRDLYTVVDVLYGLTLIVYTVWLWLPPAPEPVSLAAGLSIVALGYALQLWAIAVMGEAFCFGQRRDEMGEVPRVHKPPFTPLRHPIYISLMVIAVGMAFLTGFDARSILLVLASCIYFGIQGRAESLYWRAGERPLSE